MAGNDNVSDRVQLSKGELTYPDQASLITVERAAKLDLLTHLLSHLNSSIVVCGPQGIGKTTLLNALQKQLPSWRYCILAATTELDMATLHTALAEQVQTSHNKTALVIDDAGLLMPGLITAILQDAEQDRLRVIFALTPDELYLKTSSDPLIGECSVIELPPLSEKQCGEFLQYLADRRLSPLTVNDTVVATLYRNTHGVPGNIIATLPGFNRHPKPDRTLALLITAVILLIAIALGIQWLSQTNRLFPGHPTESNQNPP